MSHHHAHGRHHHDHDAQSWEDRADWYDGIVDLLEPELKRASEAMLEAVGAGPGTRLLDLACGPGHTTAAAQARGAAALGIDISPAMIEVAKRRFGETSFRVGSMLEPPPGAWDAITCRLGGHHADAAWIRAAWNVLAPGGRLAIAEWAPTNDESWGKGMRPPAHWVRHFEEAGFEDVTVTTCDLELATLAASDPKLTEMVREDQLGHVDDGPIYIIVGQKLA